MSANVGVVGCGFVADYYADSMRLHPSIRLIGGYDIRPQRSRRFADYHHVKSYESLEALLGDPAIDIVINLTSPESHYDVSAQALRAGKHVYAEKPVCLSVADAQALADLARAQGRHLAAAPCCALSESAQTLWKALRDGDIGKPRVAYAEVDDGLVHRMPHKSWVSASGAPWPFEDEVRLGCVRCHGPYAVSWLAMIFGRVKSVSAFATRIVGEQELSQPAGSGGPDFGVACLSFDSGMIARVTCSLLAPRDRGLRIFGDEGTIGTDDCSDDRSPVRLRRYFRLRNRLLQLPWPNRRRLLRSGMKRQRHQGAQRRDFARGIAEMIDAIHSNRPPRLSAMFGVHVTEIVLAMHGAMNQGGTVVINSPLDPIPPMPWAVR